jgi:hypothetical protein
MTGTKVAGQVYVWVPEEGETVEIAVENTGPNVLGLTHNYFPKKELGTQRAADDTTYGHGMEVSPGGWSRLSLPIGGKYNKYKIEAGGWLRLGLRGACWGLIEVPEPGSEPTVRDFAQDFEWYQGSAEDAGVHLQHARNMRGNQAQAMHKNVGAKDEMIQRMFKALEAQKAGPKVAGSAIVTAHAGEGGVLSHWTVRFENGGDTPFIGTVAFKGADKREGIGLESMGVPNRGSAAEQRIEANGNYGVLARSGAVIRLGVRGYGFKELNLPKGGSTAIPLLRFRRESSQESDLYFDKKHVTEKQQEKVAKVRFFENGRPINDELLPISYVGRDALAYAPFDPPRAVIEAVGHGAKTPGGGWMITVTNKLPEADDEGRLGFVTTLKLGPSGVDVLQLPPKKSTGPGQSNQWFLPRGAEIEGRRAKAGETLSLGTRGMGWFLDVPLPSEGAQIDTATEEGLASWSWRPDQYYRANLAPEFWGPCRLGPDRQAADR